MAAPLPFSVMTADNVIVSLLDGPVMIGKITADRQDYIEGEFESIHDPDDRTKGIVIFKHAIQIISTDQVEIEKIREVNRQRRKDEEELEQRLTNLAKSMWPSQPITADA